MRLLAALVHLGTAMGAVTALMALLAIVEKDWKGLYLWLGLAFIIDGVDGTFARWVRVSERLPRFSGDRLDLIVDYLTYVFIPAYALMAAGYLTGPLGLTMAFAILLSSLFHFIDTDSKAEDYSFVGFPAVWNIIAFYIFVFQLTPSAAHTLIAACVVLTFVPMKWVHPFRVKRWRPLVFVLCSAWAAAAFAATWGGLTSVAPWAEAVLLGVAAAVVAMSIVSTLKLVSD